MNPCGFKSPRAAIVAWCRASGFTLMHQGFSKWPIRSKILAPAEWNMEIFWCPIRMSGTWRSVERRRRKHLSLKHKKTQFLKRHRFHWGEVVPVVGCLQYLDIPGTTSGSHSDAPCLLLASWWSYEGLCFLMFFGFFEAVEAFGFSALLEKFGHSLGDALIWPSTLI